MKISNTGIAMVTYYEGLYLDAYWDKTGKVWTIGYGHTTNVYEGMKITKDQAIQFLREDMSYFEKQVELYVKVPLAQHEFDALVSFTFNVGQGTLSESTLLKKLNSGDKKGTADEFLKFVNSGGVFLEGLKKRRITERWLFLTGELNVEGGEIGGGVDPSPSNKKLISRLIYPSTDLFPRKIFGNLENFEVVKEIGDIVYIKIKQGVYPVLKRNIK